MSVFRKTNKFLEPFQFKAHMLSYWSSNTHVKLVHFDFIKKRKCWVFFTSNSTSPFEKQVLLKFVYHKPGVINNLTALCITYFQSSYFQPPIVGSLPATQHLPSLQTIRLHGFETGSSGTSAKHKEKHFQPSYLPWPNYGSTGQHREQEELVLLSNFQ